jgi:hypothetical protein
MGLAVGLLVALPVLLVFLWIGGVDPSVLIPLGVLSIGGGLVVAWKAARGDWQLHETRDVVFDRAADEIRKRGKRVCAVTEVVRVELIDPRESEERLTLVLDARGDKPDSKRRLPLLAGPDLTEPGKRVAAYLRVPFGRTGS